MPSEVLQAEMVERCSQNRPGTNAVARTDLGSCRLENCTFWKLSLEKYPWEKPLVKYLTSLKGGGGVGLCFSKLWDIKKFFTLKLLISKYYSISINLSFLDNIKERITGRTQLFYFNTITMIINSIFMVLNHLMQIIYIYFNHFNYYYFYKDLFTHKATNGVV